MPRARWFVVGFLFAAALIGGVLNERGPFGQHPSLSYTQFLADFQAGDGEQIVQWRDQVEVTEADRLLLVTVPPDRDLTADLGRRSWLETSASVGRTYRMTGSASSPSGSRS